MRFWSLTITVILSTLLSCSDTQSSSNKKDRKGKVTDGVIKTHYANGKLKAEIPVKNGKRHGLVVQYFGSGKKHVEMNYVDGKHNGLTKRYYENGNLYEETEYRDGVMDGTRKKYRQDGRLSTEATFFKGQPCAGLKEYLTDGKLKKGYPTIVIEPIDMMIKEGRYTLRFRMSDRSTNVTFYRGKLTDNCMTEMLEYEKIHETSRGVAEFDYNLPAGFFVMEEFPVIAKVKTALGNYYITTKTHNVAIENR
jgi:hypothetical protein